MEGFTIADIRAMFANIISVKPVTHTCGHCGTQMTCPDHNDGCTVIQLCVDDEITSPMDLCTNCFNQM